MHLVRGLRRYAVLAALLAFCAVLTGPLPAGAQDGAPACSNGVDDDSDNAIDGADAGCAGGSDDDETDSPYAGIKLVTIALPLVTLQGEVDAKGGVKVSKLLVRAKRGSIVSITCEGKSCPFKPSTQRMITNSLRLTRLERKLKAPTTLTMRIARPGQLGKYVQYKLRRKQSPLRTDDCLDQDSGKRTPCYED